ncbi:inositol monophosphatase [Phaeobacter sp. B1627]|uniref:inositol monophosphatase family protein n=1 Tax=Phaeobacter sp. B1627 TaxID=2583809 RepID=UPI00111848C5|nr:inositol monophosphatase [Phaeobacter sp. B1627]TNJ41223.1 inositol monophosphatase [Phaeobacter sp. B1627]
MTNSPSRLALARTLAQQAGQLARSMRAEQETGFVSVKGTQDFVTLADQAVEAMLRDRILAEFPDDGFLGEEGGQVADGRFTWVVDPIDGTTNYLHGLPEWGVSIACVREAEIVFGVIALPDLDRIAWCARGEGAFIDGQRMHLTRGTETDSRLAILGHSARLDLQDHLDAIGGLLKAGYDYRRQGAACFGLLAVAAGWADFYFEGHLNPWDAMAGILLVEEAGGTVHMNDLAQFLTHGGSILASGSPLPAEILAPLQPSHPDI